MTSTKAVKANYYVYGLIQLRIKPESLIQWQMLINLTNCLINT